MINILLALTIFAAFPEISVNWGNSKSTAVTVQAQGEDELLDGCLKSGFAMNYRFTLTLCNGTSRWLSSCGDERREIHELSFDPISGEYKLVHDRHYDMQQPETRIFSTLEEALAEFVRVHKASLQYLAADRQDLLQKKAPVYLAVRLTSECKGQHNETLSALSYFLTLGMIRVGGTDSGTQYFKLDL